MAIDDGRAWMWPFPPSAATACAAADAVQVVADGTDANSTNVALGMRSACRAYARELWHQAAAGASAHRGGRRVWFNPSLESRDFMIPGILALVLLVVTTNLSSMAIVREKELGTLEQPT
jgi:ABC-2 type transport system permease protein